MWCLKQQQRLLDDDEDGLEQPREEQDRINKTIEKRLKREKREYRSVHRLQIVGLEGSGKSTLIQQLRLLDADFDEAERRQKGKEMRRAVRVAMRLLAAAVEHDNHDDADVRDNLKGKTCKALWKGRLLFSLQS